MNHKSAIYPCVFFIGKFPLLLITCITIQLHAQVLLKNPDAKDSCKFQIGIHFSPDICYRTLHLADNSSIENPIIPLINELEVPKYGYTLGANLWIHIRNIVGIETGIHFSNWGYQSKVMELHSIEDDPNMTERAHYSTEFYAIDIPIKANFTIGHKKIRFFASAGFTTTFFIEMVAIHTYYYSDQTVIKTIPIYDDYNPVNLSPTISAGIYYKINNKMSLRIDPIFRYCVLRIANTPIVDHLYSGGLNISYYFGL